MDITVDTPKPFQVFQRDGSDLCNIAISGKAPGAHKIKARLTETQLVDPSIPFDELEIDAQGQFHGIMKYVPVGGPYDLAIYARNLRGTTVGHIRVPALLVGDIWILAGQSNMDGCGKLVNTEAPSPLVHAFYYDDRWDIARDPLCWYNEAVDPIHWGVAPEQRQAIARLDRLTRTNGAGLGVAFGKRMVRYSDGVPVGLLVCSHGGTSMEQWSPAKKNRGGRSLYGSMMRRVEAAGGQVAGCLWYQGESDTPREAAKVYRKKFREFIETLRRDLNHPHLTFLYVQLGTFFGDASVLSNWDRIREDQRLIEYDLKNVAMAAALDLGLSDVIHIDTAGMKVLGERLAHLAGILHLKNHNLKVGPRPVEGVFMDKERTRLVVSFAETNHGLKPNLRVRGFSVEANGETIPIASCQVDSKSSNAVLIVLDSPAPRPATLWYGRGLNPTVNLTDRHRIPCPAFGPMEI